MAAQAAKVAGDHPSQRRPAAARGALHLQAVGLHREDQRGPGRPPRCLQGDPIVNTPRSHLSEACCYAKMCIYVYVFKREGTQMTGLSCRDTIVMLKRPLLCTCLFKSLARCARLSACKCRLNPDPEKSNCRRYMRSCCASASTPTPQCAAQRSAR